MLLKRLPNARKRMCKLIISLRRLDDVWGRKLSLEDAVPEATGHTKAVLVIGKMVLQVVLLQVAPVRGEAVKTNVSVNLIQENKSTLDLLLVVKEIVGQIVANIAKDTTTEDSSGCAPVPVEHSLCEIPEWSGERDE